jgi:hypothetical protein
MPIPTEPTPEPTINDIIKSLTEEKPDDERTTS